MKKLVALILSMVMSLSLVACGGGEVVTITRLQSEGGKQMAAPDYFRGHPIAI